MIFAYLFLTLCVCSCVFRCMYKCSYMYTCVYICVEDRGQPQMSFIRQCLLLNFEARFLTGLELNKKDRPGGQTVLGVCLFCLPSTDIENTCYQASLFSQVFWRLNSGTCVCKTSPLQTQPFPHPLFFIFFQIVFESCKT